MVLEIIKARIRPKRGGPESKLLTFLAVTVLVLGICALGLSVSYFYLDSSMVAELNPTYSPGCSGTTRPTVLRNVDVVVPVVPLFAVSYRLDCQLSYQMEMSNSCYQQEQTNATIDLINDYFSSSCINGVSISYYEMHGSLSANYTNMVTCKYHLNYGACSNPYVILGGIIEDQICYVSNGFNYCFNRTLPTTTMVGLSVNCSEVSDLTPQFVCTKTQRLSWYSIASQSASLTGIALTVLVILSGFIMNLCGQEELFEPQTPNGSKRGGAALGVVPASFDRTGTDGDLEMNSTKK